MGSRILYFGVVTLGFFMLIIPRFGGREVVTRQCSIQMKVDPVRERILDVVDAGL